MISDELARKLQGCPLFKHLTVKNVKEMLVRYRLSVFHYSAGKYLHLAGDEYKELLIVLSGNLKAEMVDFQGHGFPMEGFSAGQMIASAVLFSSRGNIPVNLKTETEVHVIRMAKQSLFKLCQEDEQVLQHLLEDVGNRVTFLSEKLFMMKFVSLKHRLAAYLLKQSAREKSLTFTIPHSKQELAGMFDVTRQSVNRICARFSDEGLISFHGRNFVILDTVGLKELRQ